MMKEVQQLVELVRGDIDLPRIASQTLGQLPSLSRQLMLSWSDRVLAS